MKNKIKIKEGEELKEIVNFSKVDHYYCDVVGKTYIRVLCGNTFYYFNSSVSVIEEIEIY